MARLKPCPFDGRGGLRYRWEVAHRWKRFVLVSTVGFVVLIRLASRAETMWVYGTETQG
jgi:hypothetical protein